MRAALGFGRRMTSLRRGAPREDPSPNHTVTGESSRADRAANTRPPGGSTAAPDGARGSVRGVNRPWWALVPWLWCVGCDPAPVPDDAQVIDVAVLPDGAVIDPALDVGTGQSTWEALSPTMVTSAELIHGAQGGYHVFGRVRFSALPPDVYASFRVTEMGSDTPINDPDDHIRLRNGLGLIHTAQGWETSSALLVILTTVHAPTTVVGHTFQLEANLQAVSGDSGVGPVLTVRRMIRIVDEL